VTLNLAGVYARQSVVTPLKRTYLYRFNSTCVISRVVSMGRRNTFLKFTRRSLKT
jgi:hypothetical protein